jgi:hypothetical protein
MRYHNDIKANARWAAAYAAVITLLVCMNLDVRGGSIITPAMAMLVYHVLLTLKEER